MTKLLIKLFVKNHDNPSDPGVRERYGVFSSIVGVCVNIILASCKLLAGLLCGSIAIVADALNNFSDAGTSIVSFVSFRIAAKPADKEHPFGHARIEYICSMIVSFVILLVGFELFSESLKGLFGSDTATAFSVITFVILGLSVLLKLWLAIFYRHISKKINSSVIKAASVDSLSDAASTLAVLLSSIVIMITNFVIIDAIVGMLVSVMIFYAGIKLLNETKNSVLGEAPVKEIVDSIKAVVDKYEFVVGMHDLIVHNYGPNKYIASFHAEVDGKKDIYMLHDVIDNIEKDISSTLGIQCTIHMDPIETDNETVNELKQFVKQIVLANCPTADIHDFRTVVGHTHTNLIFDLVVPFDVSEDINTLVNKITDAVWSERPNCYCVITVDRT